MKIRSPLVIAGIIGLLIVVLGYIVWQKSQIEEPKGDFVAEQQKPETSKTDLSSQPQWVQDLEVAVVRGKSRNGLENFTLKVKGIPKEGVKTIGYKAYFDTSNRGTQGALTNEPIDLAGATEFSKTIDLGTCSATCSPFLGVRSIDLELSFGSLEGQHSWSKNLVLK